jgi:two-component system CheB/CheR fusion protein
LVSSENNADLESRATPADAANAPPTLSPKSKAIIPIAGIGASAGGLEAFAELLRHLEVKTGMAFVLLQHLDPTHESLLSEILARATSMPVAEVHDGDVVEPDHVYVMPPNARITVSSNTLRLAPRGARGGEGDFPIDEFFVSLAHERKEGAIGIVLSGTGSDGAKGVAAIMAAGGITFAQDRKSSKFDGMPTAAIAGGIDFVLPPEAIARELAVVARASEMPGGGSQRESQRRFDEQPGSLDEIFGLLKASRGIDFSHYKAPTIQRRVLRRMAVSRVERLEDYVAYLRAHPSELDLLFEDILIKVTSFFRDPESFTALTEHVFPAILSKERGSAPVRIWVPGCATGEEAYSIAMCLREFMENKGTAVKVEIFATDVSEAALAQARVGHYDQSIKEQVSLERLSRFFVKDDSGYRISSTIRECCVFARQDVTRDPPFSRLDLISCRNLLIYLSPGIQKRVLATFHFALNPGGFLTLGNAETIGAAGDLFDVADKTRKIFCKKVSSLGTTPPDFSRQALERREGSNAARLPPRLDQVRKLDLKGDVDRAIQAKFVPPGVVVNDRMEVLQFRGDTSPYLLHPPGDLTANLLKMGRPGLLVDLRAAIQEAATSGEPVKSKAWIKATSGGSEAVAIDVIPFTPSTLTQRFFVVLFSARSAQAREPEALTKGAAVEIRRLEHELAETKDYLNSIIEREQAANEELKSAGEEILSANEELQSTNEEMATAKEETQAANEELITLNDELQSRNQELSRVSSDLTNLFSSIQIPILMLSETLAVRHFTPPAAKALGLSAEDLGRPLADIVSKLNVEVLPRLASEVLESLQTKDQEIQDREGYWYSLRIKPYRTGDNKIEGVVVVLMDIDSMKRTYDRLKEAHDYAEAIVQTAPVPLLVLDADLRVITVNRAFCRHFQVTQAETVNARIYDLGNGQWNAPKLRELLENVLPKDMMIDSYDIDHEFPKLGRRAMRLSARKLLLEGDRSARILLAIHDLTTEKRVEQSMAAARQAAESSNQAKSDFLANVSHEIRTPLAAILGYSELLSSPEQSRAAALSCATRIRKNVEHLTELIDEILDIAKIEAGKLEVDRVQFELLPELAETFALLQSRAEGKGLVFNVVFDGEIPESIKSCPKRLRQILINIGGNALKFTDQGSVSVTVGLLMEGDRRGAGKLRFTVTDTGCGLSLDQTQRLFQPFSQADNSVTRRFGGTGLGLMLARRLAEALGGDVMLTESQVGKGSTFTITIDPGPLDGVAMLKGLTKASLEHRQEAITDWFSANQKLAGVRVLLVEDGPDNQALMSHFLGASGAIVELAANGAEAVQKAQAGIHDLVLMDIQMPILDGYEATRVLKKAGYKTPVVALTAHAMRGEREKCLAAGCVDYIPKPVKPRVLIEVVARLSKKGARTPAEATGKSSLAEDPFIGPLVSRFLENLPLRMADLHQAEHDQNWPKVADLAHQMAGAAGGYGFPELGRAAAAIEAEARSQPSRRALGPLLEAFDAICERAMRDGM